MPTVLTAKPGERVPESGIYQATKSGRRTSLKEGQRTPMPPLLDESWVRIVDPHKLRKSPSALVANGGQRGLSPVLSVRKVSAKHGIAGSLAVDAHDGFVLRKTQDRSVAKQGFIF